jgi:hypothetical protein
MSQVSHVVLVAWKDGRADAAEQSIRPAIRAFANSIPGIVSVVEGPSSSPEGFEDGLEYGFVVTFTDAAARDAYLTNPDHVAVGSQIQAAASRLIVFDI